MAKQKVSKRTGKPIKAFRLIAGGHEQADPNWEPTDEQVEDAKVRGTVPRAPTQRFVAPAVVHSDKDLVQLCGANKFQYVGHPMQDVGNLGEGIMSDPTPQNLETGFVHPGGQVNTGFQMTTGSPDNFSEASSAAVSPADMEELGVVAEPDQGTKERKGEREPVRGSVPPRAGRDTGRESGKESTKDTHKGGPKDDDGESAVHGKPAPTKK